jgi:hypothetical protein
MSATGARLGRCTPYERETHVNVQSVDSTTLHSREEKKLMSEPRKRIAYLAPLLAGMVCVLAGPVDSAFGQEGSSGNGPEVTATATVKMDGGSIRTWRAMEETEAILGPDTAPEEIPGPLPEGDPAEYQRQKEAADGGPGAAKDVNGNTGVSTLGPLAPPVLKTITFDGANQDQSGGARPPDTHGAVGNTEYVEVVNRLIRVYRKSDQVQLRSVSLGAFFGATESLFDPRVIYDDVWDRWIIIATRRTTGADDTVRRIYLATSVTSSATGSFRIYRPAWSGGASRNGDWADYPQLGMDQDALILTANIFDAEDDFRFGFVTAFAKARVYNGLSVSGRVFFPASSSLAPPLVLDQNNQAFLIANVFGSNQNTLAKYTLSNASTPGTTTLTGPVNVIVPIHSTPPPNGDQPGVAEDLDTLDGRFQNASTQVGTSLWNVHTTAVSGFPVPRYYRIDTTSNVSTQSGQFYESATSDDFNPAIMANSANAVFVTWTSTQGSGAGAHHARMRISGKTSSETVIPAGSSVFTSAVALTGNDSSGNPLVQRWGDYSACSVDPSNTTLAWCVNETIVDANTWGSRIVRIGF